MKAPTPGKTLLLIGGVAVVALLGSLGWRGRARSCASSGQVVDRDTILNRCWGLDYFPESRTLDQHIAKLRKRVETKPDETLIETVRGVGYRFRK